MSKNNENKLVPRLRFPEFQNIEGWKEKQLGEIGEFIGGGTPDTSVEEYWDGEIQWFTPTEIKEKNIKRSIRTITQKGLQNSSAKLLPKGALLITTRATIGDVGIAIEECSTNQGFQSLVVNNTESNLYWYYWITHNKNELKRRSSGSTFPEIGKNEIIKITAYSPKKNEQQKIAACLSSLDEVITAESQKLEVLKEHKKGLLQHLFPQEGETVPKVRFKEFEDSGEWKEKTLGEVAEIITGSTPSTNVKDYYDGDKMLVSPADINDNRYVFEAKTTLTDLGFSKTRKIKADSVLFVCIGSTIGKVAQNKFECATNQQINSLVPFEGYSSAFIYSLLERYSRKIASLAGKQAVPLINKTTFSLVKLPFPTDIAEQQKIATCLSSLDDLIHTQSRKIEALQLHKKGLLQGLFPNLNEVTE
jgi:type I restriction enzyme S subunit